MLRNTFSQSQASPVKSEFKYVVIQEVKEYFFKIKTKLCMLV